MLAPAQKNKKQNKLRLSTIRMLKSNHDQTINCIVVQVNNKGPGLEHSIHIKVNKWETTTKKGDHIHYFSDRYHCVCVCVSALITVITMQLLHLPSYLLIWSFVKFLWKTNGSLLNTSQSCRCSLTSSHTLMWIFYLFEGSHQSPLTTNHLPFLSSVIATAVL